MPWELAGQSTVTVSSTVNGQGSNAQTISLAKYAPGIFSLDASGSGAGAVLDSSYQLLDSANSAVPGVTYILIYCTGLGPVSNTPPSGQPASGTNLSQTMTNPTVTIGGINAPVQWAGLAPGYVGLYQVNAQVPATAPAGTAVPVVVSIGGISSNTVTIPLSTVSRNPFNVLQTETSSFTVSSLSSFPTISTVSQTGSAEILPSVGYQDGSYAANKAVYFPWQTANGGNSWLSAIADSIPQSVILTYDAAEGVSGFNNPANWGFFDLMNLNWAGKGSVPNTPAGFQGGAVIGNMTYPTPNAAHQNPVFFSYDASQPVTSPSAYETFVPPPQGGALGSQYGWCTAITDGRYVYYVPLSDKTNGASGNIFRYDTTMPFSDVSSWTSFDMAYSVSTSASAYQSAAYDGYRYIYFIPFHKNVITRYDTWGGGSGPDPASFTNPASYSIFDPTTLNAPGKPVVTGQGNPAKLAGFTGAAVSWDSAHQNEYLYFVPWAVYPGNATGGVGAGAQNPVLQSTTARVRIGTMSGSTFTAIDIFTNSGAADWEIYDLLNLTTNSAWPSSWAKVFGADAGAFEGQSEIAGYQIAFVTTSPGPVVGYVADKSQYFVQHIVDKDLFDPSGWYVSPVPPGYKGGTMGGGYDEANHILYPSAPGGSQFVVQFSFQ